MITAPRIAVGALVLCIFSGCTKFFANLMGEPTPYQPFNGSSFNSRKYGGYSETKLGPTVYRVSFTGDTMTPQNIATDYALLRSADLSLEQGYPYFAVVNGADVVQIGQVTTPPTTVTGYEQRGNTTYETKTTRPGTTYTTAAPNSSNTIVMYKTRPADRNLFIYDARDIYGQLTRKYDIKPAR